MVISFIKNCARTAAYCLWVCVFLCVRVRECDTLTACNLVRRAKNVVQQQTYEATATAPHRTESMWHIPATMYAIWCVFVRVLAINADGHYTGIPVEYNIIVQRCTMHTRISTAKCTRSSYSLTVTRSFYLLITDKCPPCELWWRRMINGFCNNNNNKTRGAQSDSCAISHNTTAHYTAATIVCLFI